MQYAVLFLMLAVQTVSAAPRELDEYHWVDVQRLVAVGDLHGDYKNYLAVLQAAQVVNAKGKWIGGETHLVQTGDIPDRGPDTTLIIQHMEKLAREARKQGGRVHNLMGNHEVMNVYGDLRYVTAEEYAAFVTRGSKALQERYFNVILKDLEARDPMAFAALPANFREQWQQDYPLGWVEHRQAWDPAWNPKGKYAQWVINSKVAIQINDMVFVHGGISGYYCQNSLASLSEMARAKLRAFDPDNPGILEDENGPLWYRGLSGVAPEASPETVAAVLERHGAGRIVVGHTPTSGVIWPRYDARVIQIDSGIGATYGGHIAYLEVTPAGIFAGYPSGKIPIPASDGERIAYLEQVIAVVPENAYLIKRLQNMQSPAPEPALADPGDAPQAELDGPQSPLDEVAMPETPKCGIAQ